MTILTSPTRVQRKAHPVTESDLILQSGICRKKCASYSTNENSHSRRRSGFARAFILDPTEVGVSGCRDSKWKRRLGSVPPWAVPAGDIGCSHAGDGWPRTLPSHSQSQAVEIHVRPHHYGTNREKGLSRRH